MYSSFLRKIKTPSLIFMMVFSAALPACLASTHAQAQNRKPITKGSSRIKPGTDKVKTPSLKETLPFLVEKLNSVSSAVKKKHLELAQKYSLEK